MPAESKNWKEERIIDIHAHISSFKGFEISLENLKNNVEAAGIDLVLVSNLDAAALPGITANLAPDRANALSAELVSSDPDHFRALLWGNPHEKKQAKLMPF